VWSDVGTKRPTRWVPTTFGGALPATLPASSVAETGAYNYYLVVGAH
jgi:hypothetical protein